MVKRNCEHCGKEFQARQADINRGWGRFCGKSCKATAQEARTGQYKALICESKSSSLVMPSNRTLPKVAGWKWRTSGGRRMIAPSQMTTGHLFFTLRVIWNAVMPTHMHVGGDHAITYAFGPSYTKKYLQEAINNIGNELLTREDIKKEWKKQLDEMMAFMDKKDINPKNNDYNKGNSAILRNINHREQMFDSDYE